MYHVNCEALKNSSRIETYKECETAFKGISRLIKIEIFQKLEKHRQANIPLIIRFVIGFCMTQCQDEVRILSGRTQKTRET